jgi:enoyl-CoA hydratase/carnithine racemase
MVTRIQARECKLPLLRVEQPADHVRLFVMQNPGEMNKLARPLLKALRTELERFRSSSESRVLILTGVENVFCTGADLKLFTTLDPVEARRYLAEIIALFNDFDALEKPTIAAINGFALGGGMELALSTDFRLMSETAVMGLPECKLGILPGAGGVQRLTHIIGRAQALEVTMLGEPIPAQKAVSMGLVSEVCEVSKLLPRAVALANHLATMSGIALGFIKKIVRAATASRPSALDKAALDAMITCFSSKEFKKGLSDFFGREGLFAR